MHWLSSIHCAGDARVAEGMLLDTIRQVQTFGSSLMQLDIRQESTRHRDVMNAITEFLEIGSYNKWSEAEKLSFLEKELTVRPAHFFPPIHRFGHPNNCVFLLCKKIIRPGPWQ